MSCERLRDRISIAALALQTPHLAPDLWLRADRQQPLLLDLEIDTDVADEASSDSLLGESLNYGTVTKAIEAFVQQLSPSPAQNEGIQLEELAEDLARVVLFQANAPNVRLQLARPRALLTAESVAVHIYREKADYVLVAGRYALNPASSHPQQDTLVVNALRRTIIIGVNPCERIDEQEVIVDLKFGAEQMSSPYTGAVRQGWKNWRTVVKSLESHLSSSHPLTIEALTTDLARIVVTPSPSWNVSTTSVKISKPCALQFARYPSVQIRRNRSDFFDANGALRSASSLAGTTLAANGSRTNGTLSGAGTVLGELNKVVLGVGTNLGSRMGNIAKALKELERDGGDGSGARTRVVDTSYLYESEAMYVVDQAKFLNAVVLIETPLAPLPLLHLLKSIEASLGREKTIRNGPRVIDLDILFFNDLVYDSRDEPGKADEAIWLKVPHASIAEREFVLRPLADLSSPPVHPVLHASPSTLLSTLLASTPSTLVRVLPLSSSLTHTLGSRTLIMSILNTTPDSFSDGGDNALVSDALSSALDHIRLGVDIVDIGGMSTRPGAADVEEEEEIRRVVPVIQAIRAQNLTIPISIDTFRPSVAKAAIDAGATIVNDVLGGSTEGMLAMMATLDVPVILMHSRGIPATMSGLTSYPAGVVQGVREELGDRVAQALSSGVKRWNIIVDPGIGFAKSGSDNLVLLRTLPAVLASSSDSDSPALPSLVGLSRKKFLGTLTGKENPKERVWATAVGVTSSIAGGADIVRVHDVAEMVDVVRVADGIYRN